MEKPLTLEKGTRPGSGPKLPALGKKRSLGRKLLKAAAALALAAVLAAAGALLFLRTDSGMEIALSAARKALAAKGIEFSAASLKGPLPGRLAAEDLALSDSRGVFLRIARAEARISLLPLISRRIRVDGLRIEGADFIRAPELPPSPEEEDAGGPLSLPPVDIAARVEIKGAKVLSGADP
ncbi:MAG: hypothetical protein LBQ12_12445, partial [Deltaproteobacteria bacterium]|nr:hypothetical protein [Deltaproteobacteria bacterium]